MSERIPTSRAELSLCAQPRAEIGVGTVPNRTNRHASCLVQRLQRPDRQ